MKFELNDKTGKDFSVALSEITGNRKKKDELKVLGFIIESDAEKNYWLKSFAFEDVKVFHASDHEIVITISKDGTLVATKENKSDLTLEEQKKVDAVVIKTYELLGVKEAEYKLIAETKGIGTSSASPVSSTAAPTAKNYHAHLTTHAAELNKALNPYRYQVNTADNTLEKLDDKNKPTGHKITINKDGSTKGDLFQDLSNTDTVAHLISEDHVAVINMHLELLKKGIKPDKKINLFLIDQGLSPEDKKKLPAIKEKIKALLIDELAKPAYADIKDYVVYDGTPIEKKTAKTEETKSAEEEKKEKEEANAGARSPNPRGRT